MCRLGEVWFDTFLTIESKVILTHCKHIVSFNPRPPKEGGLLQPLKMFLKQLLCPINCTKRFYVIISTSFTALYVSFDVYEVKFGMVVWVGGHQREW